MCGLDNDNGVHNNDYETLHVIIEGESSCAFRVESLTNERLDILERSRDNYEKPSTSMEQSIQNKNSNVRFEHEKISFIVESEKKGKIDASELCLMELLKDDELGSNNMESLKDSQATIKIEDDKKPGIIHVKPQNQSEKLHVRKKEETEESTSCEIKMPMDYHLVSRFAELCKCRVNIQVHEKDVNYKTLQLKGEKHLLTKQNHSLPMC